MHRAKFLTSSKVKNLFVLLLSFSSFVCQISCVSTKNNKDLYETLNPLWRYYKGTLSNEKKYNFSVDWTFWHTETWEQVLSKFKGKPTVHYLEIGVFEGRTLIWMLENILTHRTARATCIDIFQGNLKEVFLSNLKKSGFANKVTTITGFSQTELKYLPKESFDIIYIDGDHYAAAVLTDAVLSWQLLRNEGILIFDDYLLEEQLPIEFRPKGAVNAFITFYRNNIEIVHRGKQVILRKVKGASNCFRCSAFGQYVYHWQEKKLYRLNTNELIPLSDTERNLIEKLIKSRRFGETEISLDKHIAESREFIDLEKRLKLGFEFRQEE